VPVTVVFVDRDRILPARRYQERGLLPAHTRWVVLDPCGHVPMWDRPADTVRLRRDTATRARCEPTVSPL
jgi:pimeloyl-ACP methyl ester carboxylesterase